MNKIVGLLAFTVLINQVLSSEEVIDEKIQAEDCPFGIYGEPESQSCICLNQGVWGVATEFCTIPLHLFGIDPDSRFCFANKEYPEIKVKFLQKVLTLEEPEVAQLSLSMHKLIDRFDNETLSVPFEEDIYLNESTLITYGEKEWTLTTYENETYCLIHKLSPLDNYCMFQPLAYGDKWLKVRGIKSGCEKNDTIKQIISSECFSLKGNQTCEEADNPSTTANPFDRMSWTGSPVENLLTTSEDTIEISTTTEDSLLKSFYSMLSSWDDQPSEISDQLDQNTLSKRSDTSTSSTSSSDDGLLVENEDEVKSTFQEIGHKLMREQIDQYVDTVVASLTGLSDPGPSSQTPTGRYPVLKIFNLLKLIMQKTCNAVKGDYFELALNSFLKVQLESFHVKEPYISHNSYARIEYALKKCYNKGKAHTFVQSSQPNSTCSQSAGTSDQLDVNGDGKKIVKLEQTPVYASGVLENGATREPLTETVWKMLVNAHSYCYPYFKAYFNDHHTLTVALLPLFNNQIQDIWLKEGGYDTNTGRLYGGLLGDTGQVLKDVDHCVAASRHMSQYPWYMSRPLKDSGNKWRRRRRELSEDEGFLSPNPIFIDSGNKLCLFDPQDPVAFLGKTCT